MTDQSNPNWILEISKITIPVVLGIAVWAIQALAQRAWTEYEARRAAYVEVVQYIDSLFSGGSTEDKVPYLRAVRRTWLVGSDEVVRSVNDLSDAIVARKPTAEVNESYSRLIETLRRDLRTRRWLPPNRTELSHSDFPIQAAGPPPSK